MKTIPLIVCLTLVVAVTAPLHAIVVYDHANGLTGTNAQGQGSQFVGSFRGFAATAIDPHYFLTAKHIGGSVGNTFSFAGNSYTTTGRTDIPDSDLSVWQVDSALPQTAKLYNGTVTGKTTSLIGDGFHAHGTQVDQIPDNGFNGWEWASSGGKSAGENTIDGQGVLSSNNYSVYAIDFDPVSNANEGILTDGDSGTGSFIFENGQWRLAGVGYAITRFYTQKNDSSIIDGAIFDSTNLFAKQNDGTFVAANGQPQQGFLSDVTAYRSQILAAIPEPATLTLLALGAPLLLRRQRGRRER